MTVDVATSMRARLIRRLGGSKALSPENREAIDHAIRHAMVYGAIRERDRCLALTRRRLERPLHDDARRDLHLLESQLIAVPVSEVV